MQTVIVLKDRACELRKAAGLSQKELGEVLGLSQNAISTIESGSSLTVQPKASARASALWMAL